VKYLMGLVIEATSPEEAKDTFLDLVVEDLYDPEEIITMERL